MTKDQQEEIITVDRTGILIGFIKEALENYKAHNKGNLPEQIVMYRGGCGGPTLKAKVRALEVPRMREFIEEEYNQGYKPRMVYCLVDRNTTHRLFYKGNGDVQNPGSGTVVDIGLVEQ